MVKNVSVIQCQHFFEITGAGGNDHKLAASFRNCLGLSFGSTKGTYVTYLFENSSKFKDPVFLIRYARDNKEAVKLFVLLNGIRLPADKGDIHTLESTGDWRLGDQAAHWKTITISKSVRRALKPGKNRLKLVNERDFNWITLDCIILCERNQAEHIAGLDANGIEKLSQRDPVQFDQTTGIFTDSVAQNGAPVGAIGAGKFEIWPDGWAANGQAYVHQHEPYLGFESIYAGFVDKRIEVLRRNYDIAWVRNHVGWSTSLNFSVEHGWLWLDYSRKTKQATLAVLKVFKPGLRLTRLRKLSNNGAQTETPLAKPFEIALGNTIKVSL